jgi:RanBP-type and C3HC4-type zinc finger-containing protein 1
MYVEDKVSHRGPFNIEVTENQSVAELKLQVEQEFEIPVNVQRWILGKELATDDSATLKDHNITTERCPVFLYLVAPGITVTNYI